MKSLKSYATLALLLLCAGLLTINLFSRPGISAHAASQTPAALTVPSPVQLSNSFTKLAKESEPSVVQIISTMKEQRVPMQFFRGNPFGGEDPFGDQNPFEGPPQGRRAQGLGSGFVVDRAGYILTNNHVVEHATRIQVKLPGDKTEYTAKLVGADPELDLAVLKIDAGKALPALHMGNSDAIETGDWAVAIGSPFGLDQTMTAGIISAKGRDLGEPGHQLQRFLQTDAAINRGNSGGPLLNINGEVIGINTMIVSGSGNFEGIGFALPINLAVNSYNQIVKSGKVSRGAIGIQFAREENASLLKAYGASSGVFVQQVTPGGPASKAGIQAADVIVGINGQSVKDGDQLVGAISAAQPGSSVTLKVLRDGKTMEMPVKIGDRAEIVADNAGGSAMPGEGESTHARLGVSVQNLDQSDREQVGLSSGGVVIASVEPGSFAEDIGLQKGDVIASINRHPVASATDVRNIMQSAKPGEAMAFKVLRNANGKWNPLFLAGTLSEK
ncbi:MAG TPA: Do family serine endopeptidase [Bryobacteraceae bacterium]|nr:Do family serine endopeptidase [Bryobacteraceae bacterium]